MGKMICTVAVENKDLMKKRKEVNDLKDVYRCPSMDLAVATQATRKQGRQARTSKQRSHVRREPYRQIRLVIWSRQTKRLLSSDDGALIPPSVSNIRLPIIGGLESERNLQSEEPPKSNR